MNITLVFSLIFIAGIINGSFALPTKYMSAWKFENIWLQFAFWAFLILPWIGIFTLQPNILDIYGHAQPSLLWIIIGGGAIFGIGQMCFALALNFIGLSLGFIINLGLSIGLGFLLPLVFQHREQIYTPFGIISLVGVILAITGLIVSNRAALIRNREQRLAFTDNAAQESKKYILGVVLAILAGLSSAEQNFVFSWTYSLQQLAIDNGASSFVASNVIWPLFLTGGFIPYALYTLFLNFKNCSWRNYSKGRTAKYYFYTLLMGLFWYGSLMFYSKATRLIGALGPIVGWPTFMVLIILTSSFWGWRYKEWEGYKKKARTIMKQGIMILILAILVLGYGSYFHP